MAIKKAPPRAEPAPQGYDEALDDFSIWPTRDLVVAFKGALLASRRLPPKLPDAFRERSNANVYPYTKGPDFGNDGLGYGDVVSVNLLQRGDDGRFKSVPHHARRTRSGLTPLEPDPQKP